MNSGWTNNKGTRIKKGNILNIDLSIRQNNEKDMKIAEELRKQLKKIGIKINIKGRGLGRRPAPRVRHLGSNCNGS